MTEDRLLCDETRPEVRHHSRFTIYSRRARAAVLFVMTVSMFPGAVWGQSLSVGDVLEDYARVLQLAGKTPLFSVNVRPLEYERWLSNADSMRGHPWQSRLELYGGSESGNSFRVGLADPQFRSNWNSRRPSGRNDGALWQGKGETSSASVGGYVKAGPLSAFLRPMIIHNENRSFTLAPRRGRSRTLSLFAYPERFTRIDMPQRFGLNPFWTVDWGDSYARLDLLGFSAGLSNESLWWGPGLRNAIIMSNNAAGIPHVFLGSSNPLNVWIGKFQFQWLLGYLQESEYFDSNPTNNRRFLNAIVADFSPRFVPGLSVGTARVFNINMESPTPSFDHISILFEGFFKRYLEDQAPGGEDQLLSFFGRWAMPESGFEVYGEWARGDHSWDLRDFVIEPEHASGFLFGFQKVFPLNERRFLRLLVETIKLEAPRTVAVRSPLAGHFYVHHSVPQGYTHRGQVIGAGVGPGSNEQYLQVDMFSPWGKAGFYLARTVFDEDRVYKENKPAEAREVEFAFGLRSLIFWKMLELEGQFGLLDLLNRRYIRGNDEINVCASLAVRVPLMGIR